MLNPPGLVNALLLIAVCGVIGYLLGYLALGLLVGLLLVIVAQFR